MTRSGSLFFVAVFVAKLRVCNASSLINPAKGYVPMIAKYAIGFLASLDNHFAVSPTDFAFVTYPGAVPNFFAVSNVICPVFTALDTLLCNIIKEYSIFFSLC